MNGSPNGNGVHALPPAFQPMTAAERDAQRQRMIAQTNATTVRVNALTKDLQALQADHGALISELGRRIDLLGREQDAAKAAHAGFYGAGLWARVAWLVRGGR